MAKIVDKPSPSANGKIPVILEKRYGSHYPGDVAGFEPDTSAHLVRTGAAKYVEGDVAAQQPAKPAEPPKK
jgi:hypothetical protein